MTASEILDAIEWVAADRGGATALQQTSGRRLTYRELQARIESVSTGLVRGGMTPGDRVLFSVPPGLESVVLILAVLRSGGVVVAANPLMGEELFRSRVHSIRPRWAMAPSLVYALGRPALRSLLRGRGPAVADLAGVPGCQFVRVGPALPGVPRSLAYARLVATPGPAVRPVRPRDDDPALMVFTSGTTGAPRAVVHSAASIGASLDLMMATEPLSAGDVIYSDQLHLILPALLAGVLSIIPSGRVRPARVLADLERFRISHTFGVPSEVQELVAYAKRRGRRLPSSLRVLLLGSAPVRRAFLEGLLTIISPATSVWCVYGMTEIAPVSRVRLEEKLEHVGPGDLVGSPISPVRVRIASDGELLVKGPNLCQGYWGEAPLTEVATGDLGCIDGEGRLVLNGRKKDMIIRGRENIYPELLESTVSGIPGVRRCCLVGLYREAFADEVVVLVVEPEPRIDPGALRATLERCLREGPNRIDAGARPDRIVLLPIPLSPRSRKVDRAAVRMRIEAHLRW